MDKPFSQACANNQQPILAHLAPHLERAQSVLEVGSGTGQHAAYFAPRLPQLTWHTSDLPDNHAGINAWLEQAGCDNLRRPLAFDVDGDWPELKVDAVYSANTLHIMGWGSVQHFWRGLSGILNPGGKVLIYGPFNYGGEFTSDSNARFHDWLQQADPQRGIRDFEAVNELANAAGLSLLADHPMPANNRLLVWQLLSAGS